MFFKLQIHQNTSRFKFLTSSLSNNGEDRLTVPFLLLGQDQNCLAVFLWLYFPDFFNLPITIKLWH
jgi:hypothetical protein